MSEPATKLRVMQEVKNFIAGEFVDGNKTFDNRFPCTGEVIGVVHEAGRTEVDAAVSAARNALNGPWGRMSVPERTELLYRVADGIDKRFDEFLKAECQDTGKPHTLARKIDIPRGAANFKIFADTVKNVGTETFVMNTPNGGQALNYSVRAPKGVIGVICPWNLPLLLMTWKVAPALACGNTVVVKPSEETPTTAILLGEVMNQVGMPAGVYNVINGFGPDSAGAFLAEHSGVDAITFTGETRTGETIMRAAAKGVRDVSFELGGKNPALIFADCDIESAVEGTLRSVFANCGQVCLGTERVYVERPIFEQFVDRLRQGAKSLVTGLPDSSTTTLGPLISREHQEKVLSYYKKAQTEGAEVIIGGGIPDLRADLAGGSWIEPTIWTGLPEDSVVVREEIFGPCCHVRPFDEDEEVLAMANDTPYGLAASLWTRDVTRVHRLAPRIEAGIVWVNSWFLRDLRTPFGGMKQSGIGREGGEYSLEFYTELKNICIQV